MEYIYQTPFSKDFRITEEEEAERTEEPGSWRQEGNRRLWTQQSNCTFELVWQHVPDLASPSQIKSRHGGGAGCKAPPLSEELLAIVSCWERKAQFFSKSVVTDKLTTIQQKIQVVQIGLDWGVGGGRTGTQNWEAREDGWILKRVWGEWIWPKYIVWKSQIIKICTTSSYTIKVMTLNRTKRLISLF